MKQCSFPKDKDMDDVAQKSKKTGKNVFWGFIAFFVVFATVDVFFVYKAVTTHPGVVAENAYEIGLNYNKIVEEAKKRNHDAAIATPDDKSK
jgi:nitrogen fixation protein FixH